MYTYKKTEPGLWTVGSYTPSGEWIPESDHGTADSAAKRTAMLNGGPRQDPQDEITAILRATLWIFNKKPRMVVDHFDTYELAARIDKVLEGRP